MNILVVGGAGYIGSHMCKLLAARGHQPVVLDNLSTGHREAVKWGPLEQACLLQPTELDAAFTRHRIDAVIHFAASSVVGDSVRDPLAYFRNNVAGSVNLLTAMQQHGVRRIVFSSTAAIFGQPQYTPIDEDHPTVPLNPYGTSKLMVEEILRAEASRGLLDAVALRYFNAAGADPDSEIGESHNPETHLIPRLLLQAVSGSSDRVKIFGTDYETPDGTCVRDYIHILDLCEAHLLALDSMERGESGFRAYNLGNGTGYSVLQVIDVARKVTGLTLEVDSAERRAGDPSVLIASSECARRQLGWMPRYDSLEDIIQTAWQWHERQPY